MDETNLLTETREAIAESGHSPGQVTFIGSEATGHRCTWAEFKTLADIDYDSGFGASKVATDLVVVFSDGTSMKRGEYDGSEWWEFSRPFTEPKASLPIRSLVTRRIGWDTLAEIAKQEEKDQ